MQGQTAKYRKAWVLMAAAKLMKEEEEALLGLRFPSYLKIEKREVEYVHSSLTVCHAPASISTIAKSLSNCGVTYLLLSVLSVA